MKKINMMLDKFSPYGLLLVRVVLGSLFFLHGVDKFEKGFEAMEPMFASLPAPEAAFWFVAIAEVVLGIALVIGLLTRLSAAILGFILIGAIITVKVDKGVLGGAELDLTYLSGLVALVVAGAGAFSADRAARLDGSHGSAEA